MLYCVFRHHFRRPDHYASLAACALSLTLSHGRGNSVAVVFAVTRFLLLCVFAVTRFLLLCVFAVARFLLLCVFAVARFLLLCVWVGVCFSHQSYRFSNLAPSPVGEGWGEGGKPQVCIIPPSSIIFRRPDHYASLTACALSLTLSHGRGNSVAVVFAVTRFLPLCVFTVTHFGRRYFPANLTTSATWLPPLWGRAGERAANRRFASFRLLPSFSDGLTIMQASRLVPSP
ncbi:hypothetical protein LVJ83_08075 [Uruburuella testudinis]|uniref:Uncharacterized protein n=1 Tax=Uruburuella testudinis TaxID=1282863 RepID=A0ABY4DPF8_9NEIS|nr:hypothetical protein [Uruburuella testudinis]UOO80943.1 hypothetical protein LVJ83_08075 [Uruburuella testudinis]